MEQQTVTDILEARSNEIVRVSIVGIIANVFLAAFKAVIGVFSNSIAIILDAVNNLSDALSSIITIVGTKLANKVPDREHPYGHGRIEYLTAIIIAVIVLYAGITAGVESVQRIIHPQPADYSAVGLKIITVLVVVKIVLGGYVKSAGERLESDSLVASGVDALMDAVISASTLVAAWIYLLAGVSLEAWLGAIIALIIIKAGVDILRDTIVKILGQRVDADLAQGIKKAIREVEGVHGAYDLTLTDYGPQRLWGSVHVEVDDEANARQIDRITREIQTRIYQEFGVVITAVGVYPSNTGDPASSKMKKRISELAFEHPEVLEIHGFYVNQEAKKANFDVVISFDCKDRRALYDHIVEEVSAEFPDYDFHIILDADISD